MTVLVTHSATGAGSSLMDFLAKKGCQVIGIDSRYRLASTEYNISRGRWTLLKKDLTNLTADRFDLSTIDGIIDTGNTLCSTRKDLQQQFAVLQSFVNQNSLALQDLKFLYVLAPIYCDSTLKHIQQQGFKQVFQDIAEHLSTKDIKTIAVSQRDLSGGNLSTQRFLNHRNTAIKQLRCFYKVSNPAILDYIWYSINKEHVKDQIKLTPVQKRLVCRVQKYQATRFREGGSNVHICKFNSRP